MTILGVCVQKYHQNIIFVMKKRNLFYEPREQNSQKTTRKYYWSYSIHRMEKLNFHLKLKFHL